MPGGAGFSAADDGWPTGSNTIEHRAVTERAAGPGGAVVGLRDRLHDGQAEPEATALAGPVVAGAYGRLLMAQMPRSRACQ